MNKQTRYTFYARLAELDPNPTTELNYTTPFELLTAVLLSAQATDVGVNKATKILFPVANTPAGILALGQEGLESYINTIGLYRSKAKHLLETCRILIGATKQCREEVIQVGAPTQRIADIVADTLAPSTSRERRYVATKR